MWDLIVSVPDHCLSFYFIQKFKTENNEFLLFYKRKWHLISFSARRHLSHKLYGVSHVLALKHYRNT